MSIMKKRGPKWVPCGSEFRQINNPSILHVEYGRLHMNSSSIVQEGEFLDKLIFNKPWFTRSKAFEKSVQTPTTCRPSSSSFITKFENWVKFVTAERPFTNPCWLSEIEDWTNGVILSTTNFSKSFGMADKIEMPL
jgi:hypothetical protein